MSSRLIDNVIINITSYASISTPEQQVNMNFLTFLVL